jgi:hypothetical protein
VALFSTKLEQVSHIDAPVPIITDKFCTVPITGKPNHFLAAIREGEAYGVGFIPLSCDLRSDKGEIRGLGCFAGYCFNWRKRAVSKASPWGNP